MSIAILPSLVGGEEMPADFVRIEDNGVIADMSGFTYSIKIDWNGCTQITLSEDDGITRLVDNPSSSEYHYSWSLNETRTLLLPIGITPVKLINVSPGGVTLIDVVNIKRTL